MTFAPPLLPEDKKKAQKQAAEDPTSPQGQDKKKAPTDSRTIITKTKPLYHEQTIFSSGSKSDIWYTGDVFLTVNDG
ncbi:MAG: hypothetical protein ACK5LK_04955, partial [Chthoniobacterales bacterium]